MKVAISHTKIKPDKRTEIDAAGRRVLEALERERPQGFLYAVCPLPDGETFVTLTVTDDGVDNPLVALPEFQAFAANFKTWVAEPPTAEHLTAPNSYRSF
jgi:NifB/MoaA-like Fe-S oxidoreductase